MNGVAQFPRRSVTISEADCSRKCIPALDNIRACYRLPLINGFVCNSKPRNSRPSVEAPQHWTTYDRAMDIVQPTHYYADVLT